MSFEKIEGNYTQKLDTFSESLIALIKPSIPKLVLASLFFAVSIELTGGLITLINAATSGSGNSQYTIGFPLEFISQSEFCPSGPAGSNPGCVETPIMFEPLKLTFNILVFYLASASGLKGYRRSRKW